MLIISLAVRSRSHHAIIYHMKHITPDSLKSYQSYFDANPQNQVLQRAVMTNGIRLASRNPEVVARDKNLWSYEIPTGAIRDQKRTGTCWLMASLAMAEKAVNQRLKCEPIELSKSYLYFYDKLEMANAYWQNIIDTRDEPLDSRHVQSILHSKQSDGGYWSEAIDLIEKYGVVPKSVMPDVTDSEDSTYINPILNEKLAFGAKQLRETDDPQAVKEQLMAELYHILALSFGVPPSEFAFDFTPKKGDDDEDKKDKKNAKNDKKNKNQKDLTAIHTTPVKFWQKYGAKLTDFAMVEFFLDHKKSEWNTLYAVEDDEFMYGRPTLAATVRFSSEIEQAIKQQILHDEPVWFSWDIGKQFSSKLGILDAELWKYDELYGDYEALAKDDRGVYQDHSGVGFHATAIVGFREQDGAVTHWKVKNSWGKERGQNGYVSMHANYLEQYVEQAVINKTYLPKDVQVAFEREPRAVRYWE